jgi:hypothetical protein
MPIVINEFDVLVEPAGNSPTAPAADDLAPAPTWSDLSRALDALEARRDRIRAH